MEPSKVHFQEMQRMRAWWMVLLILIPSALVCWGAFQQLLLGEPWGDNPASNELMMFLVVVIGIGLPIILLNVKMTVVVSDNIYIKFSPFMLRPRVVTPREVLSYRVLQYRPIVDYGGWGIKGTSSDRAYNVHGNQGVNIALMDDKQITIGSQRPGDLILALDALVWANRDRRAGD